MLATMRDCRFHFQHQLDFPNPADWYASLSGDDCRTKHELLPFPYTNDRLVLWFLHLSVLDSNGIPFPMRHAPMSQSKYASCVVDQSFRALSMDYLMYLFRKCYNNWKWKQINTFSKNCLILLFFFLRLKEINREREIQTNSLAYPPGLEMLLSASSSHFCSNGFNLHIFLKLRLRASNLDMVVCEKSLP